MLQFKVLNKNLNFCPTPGYYRKKEIKSDIKNFDRKIKLKAFFQLKERNKTDKNNITTLDMPSIKPKSNWEPQKNQYTVNTFIEVVDNDIEEILEHKQTLPQNNISKAEKAIINEFSNKLI